MELLSVLSESPLTLAILTTIAPALLLGTIVIATVQAIRERVPRLDGWLVLVAAAVVSLAYCAAFGDLTNAQGAVAAGRIALLTWFAAIGGDAKLRDLAATSATRITQNIVAESDPAARRVSIRHEEPRIEIPTSPE